MRRYVRSLVARSDHNTDGEVELNACLILASPTCPKVLALNKGVVSEGCVRCNNTEKISI